MQFIHGVIQIWHLLTVQENFLIKSVQSFLHIIYLINAADYSCNLPCQIILSPGEIRMKEEQAGAELGEGELN